MTIQAILDEVLTHSPSERGILASQILASLDEDDPISDQEWDRSWSSEIRQRLARLAAGTVTCIPAEDVFAELEAELADS